jgi:hypothetical protein
MSEQQDHLQNLLAQRDGLVSEINDLNAQAASKRELLLRAAGAIEYLQQIGVKLPEPESTPEAPPVEGEVVNAEGEVPVPEVSTNFN